MQVLNGLISRLRATCESFVDCRATTKHVTYSMADIGMAAFAMFFMQSASFLAFQRMVHKHKHTSNLMTLFGNDKIPSDPHIRSMLDEVPPDSLQSSFDDALTTLERAGGLSHFYRFDNRLLVALDGTEYFCSQTISCPHCLVRKRRGGTQEYSHAMLGATIVAPGQTSGIHLMSEFIENADGAEKQDCERSATKRWLASAKSAAVAKHRPIFLGDDLFSCQPIVEAVTNLNGADFIFVAKRESHKTLYDALDVMSLHTMVTRGQKGITTTYRFAHDVPLRTGNDARTVNWCAITITNANGKATYNNAFVTSLPIDATTVADIVQSGRARWKIENGSFNILKNNGYNFAHNFGHGKHHLAALFATMNLLAFTFHVVSELIDDLWQRARKSAGKRTTFFNEIVAICNYHIFDSWRALLTAMVTGNLPPPTRAP